MQDVLSLTNGGTLKVTTEEFVRKNGDKIHEKGIEPDVVIDIPKQYENIQEVPWEEDNQVAKAIEVLKEKN